MAGYAIGVWFTIILEGVYLLADQGREAEAEGTAKKDAAPATGKKKKSGGGKVIDKRSK